MTTKKVGPLPQHIYSMELVSLLFPSHLSAVGFVMYQLIDKGIYSRLSNIKRGIDHA